MGPHRAPSSDWQRHAILGVIAALVLWYLVGIVLEVPGLRGPDKTHPFSWQWAYRQDRRAVRMLLALACVAASAAVFYCGRRWFAAARRPAAVLGFLLVANILFRAGLTLSDRALLSAGPARALLPRPNDYLLEGAGASSARALFAMRHLPDTHEQLRYHCRNKPPGGILLARCMHLAARRLPWLRQAIVALHRCAPRGFRFHVAAGAIADEEMLAAAILWSYTMTLCAIVAALPLYALARDMVGEIGALCAAAFWLFSPSVLLFSPELDQAVALLGLVGFWLAHVAYERASVVRAGLCALVLWACLLISFSGLSIALLLVAYVWMRTALDLLDRSRDVTSPGGAVLAAGARLGLVLLVLAVLTAGAVAASSFEGAVRVAGHSLGRPIREPLGMTFRGTVQYILLWGPFSGAGLARTLMLVLGVAFHLAILCGVASGLCSQAGGTQEAPARSASWRRVRRFWLWPALGIFVACMTGWLLVRYGLGLRLGQVFHLAIHQSQAKALVYRDYWTWFSWSPVCFMLFGGLAATSLWAWLCISGNGLSACAASATYAVCLALLSANVSGVTRGEAERNWMLLLPAIFIGAGAAAANLRSRAWWLPVVFALHLSQAVLFSEFLEV